MKFSAMFLGRDGVINHNHGYVQKREYFDFIDGIFDVARYGNAQKYELVVVTNQAGIGRGHYTEADFHQLTSWMCQHFLGVGVLISKVYFSLYHPTAGLGKFLKDGTSRKPHQGIILQAQEDISTDLSFSILNGDKVSDIQVGNRAGVSLNLLLSMHSPNELAGLNCELIATLSKALPYLHRGLQ